MRAFLIAVVLLTYHFQGFGMEKVVSNSVHPDYFGIQVVDADTGEGVPLVELKTVNGIRSITDNAGWIAWDEPGLMHTEVFWHISGPGVVAEKDRFGYHGVRAVATPGTNVIVKVKSSNIATRLGRLTGQGLYHHSERLGLPVKVAASNSTMVMGQDSVQAVQYQNRLFWLWGDTDQARYPLGNFHTTTAFTALNAHPEQGLVFDYLMNPQHPTQLRKSLPIPGPGVVWMFGLLSLQTDDPAEDRVFSGFTRQAGLVPPDERGIAEFDPQLGHFRKVAEVPLDREWSMPAGHAVRVKTTDGDHFYFCNPFAHVRVEADTESIQNWQCYQQYVFDPKIQSWQWQQQSIPTLQQDETQWLQAGSMLKTAARYQLYDPVSGNPIQVHNASIHWNEFRQRYIMIALQRDPHSQPSFLGEVWYAESDHITGPWSAAVKIVTHPQYTFYNVVHHPFFDREQGRFIYFEGTYTQQFSAAPYATPRYDYNQLMYRLDLAEPRLQAVQAKSN